MHPFARIRRLDQRAEAAWQRWLRAAPKSEGAARRIVGRRVLSGEPLRQPGRNWGLGHGILGSLAWAGLAVRNALVGNWSSAVFWTLLLLVYLSMIFLSVTTSEPQAQGTPPGH